MKFTKRNNLFETNSSSVHAICIGDDKPVIDHALKFKLGEYGWDNETLNTPFERASYLWTAICHRYYSDSEKIEGIKNRLFRVLTDGGVSDVEFENPSDNDDYYIDHVDSLDDWLEEILNSDSKILSYLFSADSIVVTGNDNGGDTDLSVINKPMSKIFMKYN